MATNRNLIPSSPDFDDLKAAQRAFLRVQDAFRDYDFEGSNISELIELQSFNTWLNGFWLNMIHSERMLDSAQLRDNIVSIAKDLNYTPRSMHSAAATLNMTFPTTGISLLKVQKGTQFSGTNHNGSFVFVTDKTQTLRSSNGYFSLANLEIFEGHYANESFIMDRSSETQRFVLSDPKIDTDSLAVTVTYGNTVDVEYVRATSLYGLGPTSNVFFLQATSANTYELEFGLDVLGHRPEDGALIKASYRVCSGNLANEVGTFVLDTDIGSLNGGQILSPL